MFCTNCGSRIADGARFCPRCGARTAVGQPTPAHPGAPVTAPMPDGESAAQDVAPEAVPAEEAAPEAADATQVVEPADKTRVVASADETRVATAPDETRVMADETRVMGGSSAPTQVLSEKSETVAFPDHNPDDTDGLDVIPDAPGPAAGVPAGPGAAVPPDVPATPDQQQPSGPSRRRSKVPLVIVTVALLLAVAAAVVAGLHYVGALGDPAWLRFLPMRDAPATEPAAPATTGGPETVPATSPATAAASAQAASSNVTLPNLAGKTEDEARKAITDAGLAVGNVTTRESSSVVAGRVISQSASGSLPKGTKVDLVVSTGTPAATTSSTSAATKSYVVVEQAMTWTEAEAYCEQNGGRLAVITSQADWDQVSSLIQASDRKVFWLGARRSGESFTWVDGSSLSFEAFADGEPNDDTGDEDYLAVLNSNGSLGWYDVPNDVSQYYKAEKIGFVMEKDA